MRRYCLTFNQLYNMSNEFKSSTGGPITHTSCHSSLRVITHHFTLWIHLGIIWQIPVSPSFHAEICSETHPLHAVFLHLFISVPMSRTLFPHDKLVPIVRSSCGSIMWAGEAGSRTVQSADSAKWVCSPTDSLCGLRQVNLLLLLRSFFFFTTGMGVS